MLPSGPCLHLSWYNTVIDLITLRLRLGFAIVGCLWCWRTSAKSDFRVTRTEYLSPLESDLGEVYCTSVSEQIPVSPDWFSGTDHARRFGCRNIKVPSAPIFFNTVYRHVVLLLLQLLFLTYSLTTTEFVNSHLYLNIMYLCCGSDCRNNLRVSRCRHYLSTFFLVYVFKCVITLCKPYMNN